MPSKTQFKRVIPSSIFLAAASLGQAWTLVCVNGTSWSANGAPPTATRQSVHVPNLSSGPRIYFCIEQPTQAYSNETASADVVSSTSQASTTWTGKQIGEWQKIVGSTTLSTFNGQSSQTWPTYVISQPASPYNPRQYKVGHRIYGYIQGGGFSTSHQYVSITVRRLGSGSIKITLSDEDLAVKQEPDVIAQPVTNLLGEPTITINGQADKLPNPLAAPASYTLAWNAAGATTSTVTGGSGTGAMSGSTNPKSFTNVPQSTQTYTLTTQGNAALQWKISTSASWEIFRGSTSLASGTGIEANYSTNVVGTYIIRVNGLERLAEDEVITLTEGFIKRAKTVQVKILNP